VCAVSRANKETSSGVSRCGMGTLLDCANPWSHHGTTVANSDR
jgi:hypothetical protein